MLWIVDVDVVWMWMCLRFTDVDWIYRFIQSNPIHTEPYTKVDFLAAFQQIHERMFKRKTILSAWEKAGLFPFNLALVEGKMAVFESQATQVPSEQPMTPPPILQLFQHTPTSQMHGVHMEYLRVQWLDSYCTEEPLTPGYYRAL
jgi:hypothetical protein